MFRMFLFENLFAILLSIISAGLQYGGPLIIKFILQFIRNPKPTEHERDKAYMWTGLWVLLYFLRIIFN